MDFSTRVPVLLIFIFSILLVLFFSIAPRFQRCPKGGTHDDGDLEVEGFYRAFKRCKKCGRRRGVVIP